MTLRLDGNGLIGEIPPELTHLSTLAVLQMSSNYGVQAQLPKGISRLTDLEHIAVSRNLLTGEFPEELCEIPSLKHIFLGFNELEGNIPDCIDGLVNLETLFVSVDSM